MSIDALTPRIREILTAPNTDLSTISAKRVRLQLLNEDPSLSESWVRENKADIDKHIAGIFGEVSQGGQASSVVSNGKRKHEDDDDTRFQEPSSSLPMQYHPSPSPSKPKSSAPKVQKAKSSEDRDAAVARQLALELNARPHRAAAPPTKAKAKSKANGTKKKKSSATVGSDDDPDAENTPKKGGAKGGFGKEYQLSEPLSNLLQTTHLSRPQVVKKLWEHIKGNQLQNPHNKKEIMCDQPMRMVFGVEKIDMFAMNKVLGQHLYDREP